MAVTENDLLVGPLTPAAGVTTISLDFYFEKEEWLEVYRSGSETPLVLGSDYTVTGQGTSSGVVTLLTPADGTASYSVYLVVPLERSSDMQLRGEFKSEPFNVEMDRIWQRLQYHWTQLQRALRLSATQTFNAVIGNILPGQLLKLNDAGTAIVGADMSIVVSQIDAWFSARNVTTATQAAALADGSIVALGGQIYKVDSSATGAASATNDLGVNGLQLLPGRAISPQEVSPLTIGGIAFSGGDFYPTGTDNRAALEALLTQAVERGRSTVDLPSGLYAVMSDFTLPVASEGSRTSRNLKLSGSGECSVFPFDSSADRVTGTAFLLSDGAQFIMPVNRTSTTLERMSIVGRVDGDALVKSLETDFNSWPVIGGGMRDMLLVNDLKSAPSGPSYIMTLPSIYGAVFSNVLNYGRTDDPWPDTAVAGADMFHTQGWRITTKGSGALGDLSQITFSKVALGVDIGETVADWSGGTEMDNINFYMLQVSSAWRGIDIKRGARQVTLEHPHLEFIASAAVRVRSNAGNVFINGGAGGGVSRTGPSGTEFAEFGQLVIGDPTASESLWKLVKVQDFDFRTLRQAGVFLFGGAGDVILDGVTGANNGGFFVAFDTATEANGYPNLWIKNFREPQFGGSKISRGRFVSRVTRGALYSAHSANGDYRWMARIENCGVDGTGAPYDGEIELPVDLDFGVRKWPPVSCWVNTLSGDRSITLGKAVPCNMPCTIEKRFGANNLNIVVPSGTTLYSTDGTTTWTGTTAALSATGFYTLERVSDAKWIIREV